VPALIDVLNGSPSRSDIIARVLGQNSTIIQGDARATLATLPKNCVQCVVTSPPYWGVRDYKAAGQIGLETTLAAYLESLLAVFHEVHRVLKNDGVFWLNIGDVYSSGDRKYRAPDSKYPQRALAKRPDTPAGLKRKDLIGIPWRMAFALQKEGWYLRSDVIWHKTNAMPESVRDRPSRCHEHLFLFSKSEHYKFSRNALENSNSFATRSVWAIPPARSEHKGHHAVFPESLVVPCIRAATHKNDLVLDPFCGTGTVGCVSSIHNRRFLGIELNLKYAQAAAKRLGDGTNWVRAIHSRRKSPSKKPAN
jgi:site-specific DNA-methyltransferase (adenine-specific)